MELNTFLNSLDRVAFQLLCIIIIAITFGLVVVLVTFCHCLWDALTRPPLPKRTPSRRPK